MAPEPSGPRPWLRAGWSGPLGLEKEKEQAKEKEKDKEKEKEKEK